MTPDDRVRALYYRQAELVILNDAVGRAMNAALAQNVSLDDPSVAYLRLVRANLDVAIERLATALIHAPEPEVAARLFRPAQDTAPVEWPTFWCALPRA